jgi:DNA-directed RNA polymerase subunit H (RpoH/RPB5)
MSSREDVRKSWQTLREMIQDRSVHDPRYANHVMDRISEEELMSIFAKQIFAVDVCEKVRVIYDLAIKYKFSDIKKFVEEPDMTYILVLRDKLTGTTVKSIASIPDIQVFEVKELLYNITKHILVPKHEVINNEEQIQDILKAYHTKSRMQLPLILKTDPMARYLALKTGNLVKITRASPSAGEYSLYRCCT